jgi:hypothetical protein
MAGGGFMFAATTHIRATRRCTEETARRLSFTIDGPVITSTSGRVSGPGPVPWLVSSPALAGATQALATSKRYQSMGTLNWLLGVPELLMESPLELRGDQLPQKARMVRREMAAEVIAEMND